MSEGDIVDAKEKDTYILIRSAITEAEARKDVENIEYQYNTCALDATSSHMP